MTINQGVHPQNGSSLKGAYGRQRGFPGGDRTDDPNDNVTTVYDLPEGSPPYTTDNGDGTFTRHEPSLGKQGDFDYTQAPGQKNDPANTRTNLEGGLGFGRLRKGEDGKIRRTVDAKQMHDKSNIKLPTGPGLPDDTSLRGMVEGFVKDTFEDDDTGRLEAGRAIAAARSVAGRGQGSASGGMLAHAADVSMSAADRAQEKMFGRKLAVSGIAEKIEKADLELSKMDENTRRNTLAAIIMAAAGGMSAENTTAIIEAYENGDSQAAAIIAELWNKRNENKGNGDDSDGGN